MRERNGRFVAYLGNPRSALLSLWQHKSRALGPVTARISALTGKASAPTAAAPACRVDVCRRAWLTCGRAQFCTEASP